MSNPNTHPTVIWAALLVLCEASTPDLSDNTLLLPFAQQMSQAGILVEPEPGCFTLSSNGHRLALLLEGFRNYSLGIDPQA